MRCRSQDSYIFVFRIGTIPILIKKTYSEVEELTKQGCEDALINKTTKVMVLKPMDKCKNINIETMEIDKFLQDNYQKMIKTYIVHFEPVIDMRYKSPFIVMIYTDSSGVDNQTMLFFNFDEEYIIQQCIEPTQDCKKDLYA